jgi:hypothetical protein
MRVRIVLRDRATGLYYRGAHQWVRNGYDALTFANIIDAEAFCRAEGLADLQCIQQSGYFFRTPQYRAANATAQAPVGETASH